MRKLTQRLLIILTLVVLVIAAAWTTPIPTVAIVEAGGSDCEVAGQVCRQMSQGIYNLCIELGGSYDTCAWQEAQNTISCMNGAGCPLNN